MKLQESTVATSSTSSQISSQQAIKRPCRFCGETLKFTFVDLGMSPLANSYLKADQLQRMEPFYPLHAYVCHHCFLVQLEEFENPDHIFSDYAYFSSYSESYLAHAKSYTQLMIERFGFGPYFRLFVHLIIFVPYSCVSMQNGVRTDKAKSAFSYGGTNGDGDVIAFIIALYNHFEM